MALRPALLRSRSTVAVIGRVWVTCGLRPAKPYVYVQYDVSRTSNTPFDDCRTTFRPWHRSRKGRGVLERHRSCVQLDRDLAGSLASASRSPRGLPSATPSPIIGLVVIELVRPCWHALSDPIHGLSDRRPSYWPTGNESHVRQLRAPGGGSRPARTSFPRSSGRPEA